MLKQKYLQKPKIVQEKKKISNHKRPEVHKHITAGQKSLLYNSQNKSELTKGLGVFLEADRQVALQNWQQWLE